MQIIIILIIIIISFDALILEKPDNLAQLFPFASTVSDIAAVH